MFSEALITGGIVNGFIVCKKKAWLLGRHISPESSNENLLMGKVLGGIHGEPRRIGNIEVDEVRSSGHFIVKEYKKTFSNLKASEAQLLFYMKEIKEDTKCKSIEGYVVSIEDDKKHWVEYNRENEAYIENLCAEIVSIVSKTVSPPVLNNAVCHHCGHNLYCL